MISSKASIDKFKQSLPIKDQLQYANGSYMGEVRAGLRHGKGVLEFTNGTAFCGYFRDDMPNG